MKKFFKLSATVIIISISGIFSAFAHDMWIAPESFSIEKGDAIKATFPSAHVFPADDKKYVDKEIMIGTFLISPSGKNIKVSSWDGDMLQTKKLKDEGTYLVVSGNKGGFSTKTTDGKYEKKPKNEVGNAAKSTYSKKFTKAIITVGKAGGNSFSKVIGQEIEIVPLNDPAFLKTGDQIAVKVLLNGKPYETEIDATYDTFSKEKNVFADKVKTDSGGFAKIKISKNGVWLLRVSNKKPYSNPEKADEQSFTATLTFYIK